METSHTHALSTEAGYGPRLVPSISGNGPWLGYEWRKDFGSVDLLGKQDEYIAKPPTRPNLFHVLKYMLSTGQTFNVLGIAWNRQTDSKKVAEKSVLAKAFDLTVVGLRPFRGSSPLQGWLGGMSSLYTHAELVGRNKYEGAVPTE